MDSENELVNLLNEWKKEIRSKAIDDFAAALKQDVMAITFGLRINDVDRVAEKLKGGVSCE